jgi:hypothetical protein
MMRTTIAALTAATLSAISACAPPPIASVTEILRHGNCQQIDKGAHMIDYDELARLRGAQLVQMEAPPAEQAAALPMIVVSFGTQPTPGYRVVPTDLPRRDGGTVIVRVALEAPPWDALREQSRANPCLVLGIEEPDITRVDVETDAGELLGTIDLTRRVPPVS